MIELIIGDTQIESTPSQDRLDNVGRSIRFQENNTLLREMLDYGHAQGARTLIHLGDVTEHKNPDSATMTAVSEFFAHAIHLGYDVHVIAGNHDMALHEISSSSLAPLAAIAPQNKFHAYHDVTRVGNWVFLPYQHGKTPLEIQALIEKALVGAPEGEDLFLYGHYAVKDSRTGANNLRVPGDTLSPEQLCAQRFKRIYMGHIHKRQVIDLGKGLPEVIHPGSPYIVDHGEREDKKGFVLYDSGMDKVRYIEPENPRRWIYAPWTTEAPTWTDRDIVKFTGEYSRAEAPKESIQKKIKDGIWPDPFSRSYDLKLKSDSREVRDKAFEGLAGFREAAALYISRKWHQHSLATKVLDLVLGSLKEANLSSPDKFIIPISVSLRDFMSYETLDYEFTQGEPTLITGPNGRGKTNFFIGILFALTGEVSKRVSNATLVRQTAKAATVSLLLKGSENYYKIERKVTLTAKGASQKVKLSSASAPDGPWTDIADGGVKETSAILSRIIGATFTGLQATNFMFQRQSSPFIDSESSERKSILGDILGFEPMAKAHRVINELRLTSQRAMEDLKTRLNGLREAWDEGRATEADARLTRVLETLPGLEKEVSAATAVDKEFREAVVRDEAGVRVQEDMLKALPNSESLLAAKEAILKNTVESHAREKAKKLETYHKDKDEIAKMRVELATSDLPGLQASMSTNRSLQTDLKTKLLEFTEAITSQSTEVVVLRGKLDAVAVKVKTLEDKLSPLRGKDITTCSECGRPVDSSHIKNEIEKLEAGLSEALTEDGKVKVDLNLVNGKLSSNLIGKKETDENLRTTEGTLLTQASAESKLMGLSGEIQKLEKKLETTVEEGKKANLDHNKSLDDIGLEIVGLKTTVDAERTRRAQVEENKAFLEKELSSKRRELEMWSSNLTNAKLALAQAVQEKSGLEVAIRGFEETKGKLVDLERELVSMTETFTIHEMGTTTLRELPIFLLDVRLPELQDSVNRYMDEFGSSGLQIELSSQTADGKEVLEILVDNGTQPALPIEAYSGGQNERIEICIKQALSDLAIQMRGVSLGLAAYDEPSTSLEKSYKTKFIEMLHQRCSSGQFPVTLVISHDQTLMSGFNKRFVMN